jgi:hypothetical protein
VVRVACEKHHDIFDKPPKQCKGFQVWHRKASLPTSPQVPFINTGSNVMAADS